MTTGYYDAPLAETLGLKRGMRCWFHNMPESVRAQIDPEGAEIEEQPTASDGLQCVHLFVTDREKLVRELTAVQPLLVTNGFIWVSWPKNAIGVDTDITDDVVREVAASAGLVEVTACAVDATWSALKLMIPKEERAPPENA